MPLDTAEAVDVDGVAAGAGLVGVSLDDDDDAGGGGCGGGTLAVVFVGVVAGESPAPCAPVAAPPPGALDAVASSSGAS